MSIRFKRRFTVTEINIEGQVVTGNKKASLLHLLLSSGEDVVSLEKISDALNWGHKSRRDMEVSIRNLVYALRKDLNIINKRLNKNICVINIKYRGYKLKIN